MTLRLRLTLAFVVVVLVPLFVGALLVARTFPATLEHRQQAAVSSSSRLVGQLLRATCDRARTTAEAVGRAATANTPAEAAAAGASLVQRGLADGVRVAGKDGKTVVEVGSLPVSPVDCASGQAEDGHLAAVVPLLTAKGVVVGVALASFDVRAQVLNQVRGALGDADVVLIARDGTVVAESRTPPDGLMQAALRHPEGTHAHGWVAAGLATAGGQPYAVVVLQRSAETSGLLVDAGIVILVALVAAIGLAIISARATTRPLEELSEAASRRETCRPSSRSDPRTRSGGSRTPSTR